MGGPRAALSLPVGAERPRKAVEEGFAVPGSQFTYAIGTLVLWSQDPALVQGEQTLKDGDFTKIAIANPEAAPYGAAAVQAMQSLGVYDQRQFAQARDPTTAVRALSSRGSRGWWRGSV